MKVLLAKKSKDATKVILKKFLSPYWAKELSAHRSLLLESLENFYIEKNKGVLHIGGHYGQEAERYDFLNAKVLWVEAIPDVHLILKNKIIRYKNQKSICALLGDINQDEVSFQLASNNYASSSLFGFGKELNFGKLRMNQEIKLRMQRLDSLLDPSDIASFSHWVIDVQGAELLVLKGAGKLLEQCQSLLIEVSTREVYLDGAKWEEIHSFLLEKDFTPVWEPLTSNHENILFLRN